MGPFVIIGPVLVFSGLMFILFTWEICVRLKKNLSRVQDPEIDQISNLHQIKHWIEPGTNINMFALRKCDYLLGKRLKNFIATRPWMPSIYRLPLPKKWYAFFSRVFEHSMRSKVNVFFPLFSPEFCFLQQKPKPKQASRKNSRHVWFIDVLTCWITLQCNA